MTFGALEAAVDFPDRISFTLDARATIPIERVELRYRVVGSQVISIARPRFEPRAALQLRYDRDMRTNYLPPGVDLRYWWRLELADGSLAESPVRLLRYLDTRWRWVERQRGMVELLSAVHDPAYIDGALDVVQEAVETFTARFAVTLAGPVRVVLYPSPEALRTALPVGSEEWIGGVAFPQYRLVLAGIAPGFGAEAEFRRILSHEVLHLLIAAATDNPFAPPPAWLDEGLATAYQMSDDPRLAVALQRALREGTLPSVRALSGSFGTDPERALLGYAASRSIVQYLVATYGEAGVARLLAVYREGVTDDQALQRSVGLDVEALDRAWRAWLRERARLAVPAPSELVPPGVLLSLLTAGIHRQCRRRWRRRSTAGTLAARVRYRCRDRH